MKTNFNFKDKKAYEWRNIENHKHLLYVKLKFFEQITRFFVAFETHVVGP